jgi:hypothetical protein
MEMTRGASKDDRLNELFEAEPLVGVVDRPCNLVSPVQRQSPGLLTFIL